MGKNVKAVSEEQNNRVGRLMLSSHTTVHTVRYTAVQP